MTTGGGKLRVVVARLLSLHGVATAGVLLAVLIDHADAGAERTEMFELAGRLSLLAVAAAAFVAFGVAMHRTAHRSHVITTVGSVALATAGTPLAILMTFDTGGIVVAAAIAYLLSTVVLLATGTAFLFQIHRPDHDARFSQ